MRRLRRTKFSAFVLGLFWASACSAAAVSAYYYFAPPLSEDGGIADIAAAEQGVDRWARHAKPAADTPAVSLSEGAPSQSEPVRSEAELLRAQSRVARQQADVEAQRVLTRSIQQELTRVGCYKGAVDGRWSDGTRGAMEAFTRAVEVKLPLSAPDYILLTMLQGQSGQTCSSLSEPTVTARAAPPPVPVPRPARRPERTDQPPTWSTTVSSAPVARPVPVAEPATRTASAPAPAMDRVVPPPVTTTAIAQPSAPPPSILPGRMAVGAPTSSAPLLVPDAATPPAVAAPAPRAATAARTASTPPSTKPRRDAPPQRSASSDSGSRGQLFRSLNMNAP